MYYIYIYDHGQEILWRRPRRRHPWAERLVAMFGCLFYGFVYYLIFTR